MADYDPFAIDETDATAAAAPAAATGGGAGRISKDDLEKVVEDTWKFVCAEQPWQKSPNPMPDLSWYTPTAGFDNWTHKEVLIELGPGIAYVKINRPDNDNLMNESVLVGLIDALFNLHYRKDIRLVVFSASGTLFCGGADPSTDPDNILKKAPPQGQVWAHIEDLKKKALKAGAFPDGNAKIGLLLKMKMWHTWMTLPQFTLALVNGSAMGDGVGCVCCCDMGIALRGAYFTLSDVKMGLVPAFIAPYVTAKIGSGHAKRMIASAENMSAEKAKHCGMINEVVDDLEQAHKMIKEVAEVLTACGPRSVEAAKQLVIGVGGMPITEPIMFYTGRMLAQVTVSDEARDGMVCLQARKPKPWEETPIQPLY
uniref:3-hydroxyisobutyryl-coenzyme A hydrolase n=1 Tax=Alexandrium monilatum TaxID=311494 RepID=A0A7S4W5X6_9DINO